MKTTIGRWLVPVFGGLAFIFLLVPVAYVFAFSFNDAGRTNLSWRGFTLENWLNPCGAPAVCEALGNSLQIGAIATVLATALGTAIAIGLVRYRFRLNATANMLIFLPLATPEVVLGASLLAQFLNLGAELGMGTIIIAHTMFCISFVVVTVKARVASLDPKLEEAASDLYASPQQAFWRVTFPLLLPGIPVEHIVEVDVHHALGLRLRRLAHQRDEFPQRRIARDQIALHPLESFRGVVRAAAQAHGDGHTQFTGRVDRLQAVASIGPYHGARPPARELPDQRGIA